MSRAERDSKRITRRDFLKIGAGVAGAVGLGVGCAPAATPTAEPTATPTAAPAPTATPAPTPTPIVPGAKYGGTLTLGQVSDISEFSPYHHAWMNYCVFQSIWSPLIRWAPGTRDPVPWLAESWEIKPDGTSATVELRKGVLFHSGREMTAEDVIFSAEARKTPEAKDAFLPLATRVSEVKALNTHTVQFNFDPPLGPILDYFETFFVVDHETWLDTETAIGTGPFKVKEWVPGVALTMLRFDDYWEEGLPYLDSYVGKPFPDRMTLGVNFETKRLDVCWEMDNRDLLRWLANPDYTVYPGVEGYLDGFSCSVITEPMTNKKLRQAVAWAFDRERYIDVVYGGVLSYPTCVTLPRTNPAFPADLEGKFYYDLDRARDLVVEAGYAAGVDVEILCSESYRYGQLTAAEILADGLAQIGVRAKISNVETATHLSRHNEGNFHIIVVGPGRQHKDPALCFALAKMLRPVTEPPYRSSFYDEEYAKIADEILGEPDFETRKEMYHRMMEIMQDSCHVIPVCTQPRPQAVQNYVKNYAYEDDQAPYMDRIYLEK